MGLIEDVERLVRDLDANLLVSREEGHMEDRGDYTHLSMDANRDKWIVTKPAVYAPDENKRENARRELRELLPQLRELYCNLQSSYDSCYWIQFRKKKAIKGQIDLVERCYARLGDL